MNRMTTSKMEVSLSGGSGRGLCTGSIMTFGGLFCYNMKYHRIVYTIECVIYYQIAPRPSILCLFRIAAYPVCSSFQKKKKKKKKKKKSATLCVQSVLAEYYVQFYPWNHTYDSVFHAETAESFKEHWR